MLYILVPLFVASSIAFAVSTSAVASGFHTQNGGTTGGQGGQVVQASTGKQIHEALCNRNTSETPIIIQVSGTINHGNTEKVSGDSCNTAEDKIELKDIANVTLIGVGGGATFDQLGIHIRNSQNIIIRNVHVKNVKKSGSPTSNGGDAIGIEKDVRNVWVDHVTLEASGGDVLVSADGNVASAIKLHATAGTDQTIVVENTAGTGDAAINLKTAAGGITVNGKTGIDLQIDGTDELAITATTATFGTNIVIPNGGNIGSVGDADAIAIASNGTCTLAALGVTGGSVLTTTLSVGTATTLKTTLSVGGASRMTTTLSVGTNSTMTGTISVGGVSTLTGNVSVGGTIYNTAVTANTAKTGITPAQASEITTNTAKKSGAAVTSIGSNPAFVGQLAVVGTSVYVGATTSGKVVGTDWILVSPS